MPLPIYSPPVSPHVDFMFDQTVTYVPPVSPHVDFMFGANVTPPTPTVERESSYFLILLG
jgi:hypothetical protein